MEPGKLWPKPAPGDGGGAPADMCRLRTGRDTGVDNQLPSAAEPGAGKVAVVGVRGRPALLEPAAGWPSSSNSNMDELRLGGSLRALAIGERDGLRERCGMTSVQSDELTCDGQVMHLLSRGCFRGLPPPGPHKHLCDHSVQPCRPSQGSWNGTCQRHRWLAEANC